jgi:replication-associated recombination protein RarA
MATQQIFESEPQAVMDLGQPKQNPIGFPQTLAERYQPTRLADFVGLTRPRQLLAGLVAKPRACNLLFVGPPGAGKTAMGMCFAAELPGSLHHVSAQKCDVATLDALAEKFAYAPPVGKFWICLIDEADQMTDKAQLQFLSRLDGTAALRPIFGGGFERGEPLPIIWIFTCNGHGAHQTEPPYSLAARFVSRCWQLAFEAAPRADLSKYLEKVWKAENGPATPEGYFDYIAEGVGVRDALMRLDVDLLAGPRERPVVPPTVSCDTKRAAPTPRTVQDVLEARTTAAKRAWETRRRNGWQPVQRRA